MENYLGFPGGVSPETFVSLGRAHVEHEGGTVIEDMVTSVERAEPGFHVEAGDGCDFVAISLLVASAYDGSYLDGISGRETADPEGFLVGEHGRTAVDGLYAAGWIVDETAHQGIINAGHGARVALALIRDDLCERYWEEIADRYVDWVVREGRYGGEGWDEHVAEWFDREMLPEGGDGEIDPAITEGALEDLKAEFLGREITEDERRRREKRGYDLITAHLETTNP